MYLYVCIHIYIYIYIHTHIHTPTYYTHITVHFIKPAHELSSFQIRRQGGHPGVVSPLVISNSVSN